MTIDEMLALPGRYACASPGMVVLGVCCVVEVDAEGRCWQLDRHNERDGELSRDGWAPGSLAEVLP